MTETTEKRRLEITDEFIWLINTRVGFLSDKSVKHASDIDWITKEHPAQDPHTTIAKMWMGGRLEAMRNELLFLKELVELLKVGN